MGGGREKGAVDGGTKRTSVSLSGVFVCRRVRWTRTCLLLGAVLVGWASFEPFCFAKAYLFATRSSVVSCLGSVDML